MSDNPEQVTSRDEAFQLVINECRQRLRAVIRAIEGLEVLFPPGEDPRP